MKPKTFESFLWHLKTIWSLQEFSKPLRDFLNFALVCKGILPRYRNDKNMVFFSIFVNWSRFMNNLSTSILKQLSINDKRYPFSKQKCFKKTKFFMKLCSVRTNFKTTISKSINHTKFVYFWQEIFKMVQCTTKSRFPINSCYKFHFSPRYFYIKKWQFSIAFLVRWKKACLADKH